MLNNFGTWGWSGVSERWGATGLGRTSHGGGSGQPCCRNAPGA
jgi:hypothetical protein